MSENTNKLVKYYDTTSFRIMDDNKISGENDASIFHFMGSFLNKNIKMVIRRANYNGMKDYEQ